jgi:ferrous iron transport protein A
MPLTVAPIGVELNVRQYFVKGDMKRHLENLGILPGQRITLLAENGGDLIVRVCDSRLAINRGLAMKIFVD